MKLVKCQIVLQTAEDYTRVINALLHIFMSHEAKFEAPRTFKVTCYCTHVQAEKNLDHVMEELKLHCQKQSFEENGDLAAPTLISAIDRRLQELVKPTYIVSEPLQGRAAA